MTIEREEALWLYAERRVSMDELAEISGLPGEVLKELVDYGALRAAARLRQDLELETPALALAISFLERIQSLESELRYLEARLARPRR